MLVARSKLNLIRFNDRRFRQDLERAITSIIYGSMREFVRGCLTQARPGYFPVWSGMAKSSLLPLAEFLEIPFSVTPKQNAPDRRAEGYALGRQGNFLIVRRNQYGAYSYEFKWTTEVPHFEFLEFEAHPHVPSAPWYAIKAGNRLAQAYIDSHMNRIPNINNYIIQQENTVR